MYKSGLKVGTKAVTLAITPEALIAANTPARWVEIQALEGNTNPVAVQVTGAASLVGINLDAGERFRIEGPNIHGGHTATVQINEIFIDVTTDGEGVNFFYVQDDSTTHTF